jgi:hypothetical protein
MPAIGVSDRVLSRQSRSFAYETPPRRTPLAGCDSFARQPGLFLD